MKKIKCLGRFSYTKNQICAIIKISSVNSGTLTKDKCYPIIYDFFDKKYYMLDDRFDFAKPFMSSPDIDEIVKKLFIICDFSMYKLITYCVYDIKTLSIDNGFRSTFTIDWDFDTYNTKKVSKKYQPFI